MNGPSGKEAIPAELITNKSESIVLKKKKKREAFGRREMMNDSFHTLE